MSFGKGEMTMRSRNMFLFIAMLATVMVMSNQVLADKVIGVNFVSCWTNTAMSGKTFDGLSNWTDSVPIGTTDDAAKSGTGLVVLGSNDYVTCDWTSNNVWYGGEENTPDQQLYRGYLDDGSPGAQVTIKGLTAWLTSEGLHSYTIRIYQGTDNGASFRPIDVKSGDTILETVQSTNPWTTDGGLRANVYTSALTADTIVLQPLPRSGSSRGTISGFKIIGIDKFLPVDPVPAVGTEVPVSQVLSWTQAATAADLGVTYNVYFGTDPNELSPNYYGNTSVKTTTADSADFFYDPELTNSTTYYWRVDALEPNLPGNPIVHTGAEWWFTTQPASPRIEVDPVSVTVKAGTAQVEFSVSGINIATYQWYKDGVALTAAPDRYMGENTATLTVYDIQIDDEGFYYCVADNSLNEPDTSAAAQLVTERLVGWWKLDGDLTDSVPTGVAHDGASVDPNFVAIGKDGGALEFFGDADGLVVISNSADFFNFYPRGYTIAAWVKTTQTGWGAYMGKEERPGDPWKGFILTQTDGNAIHTLRQAYGDLGSGTKVADDAWHYVTGTYDASLKQIKVYVDGVLRSQASTTAIPSPNPSSLIFGDEALEGAFARYIGLLDDVRIWSYVLDPVTVATLYTDFNPGKEVCVENHWYDVSGPEGVKDCRVNLFDFVPFAQAWLDCNIVPTCIP